MTGLAKPRRYILCATVALIFALLFVPGAGAAVITEGTVDTTTVTQGAILETHQLLVDGAPCKLYSLKVDLKDSYLNVRPLYGRGGTLENIQSVTGMALEGGAVAAINADFFQMASGKPIGLTVQNGKIITSPALRSDMYGMGIYRGNVPQILVFGFSGVVETRDGDSFPLSGVNKPQYLLQSSVTSDVYSLQLYTPQWGGQSRGKVEGLEGRRVEAVVINDVVESVLEDGEAFSIPPDGFVLAGHGVAGDWMLESLKVGEEIKVSYSLEPGDELISAIGGQSLLVKDGQVPVYFDQDIAGNRSRSAAGYSQDGRYLYFVAVERGPDSRGMTQREIAQYMVTMGVWRAVNLDGGGSTTLVARPSGHTEVKAVNAPELGTLRRVPTAWGLFTSAPPGSLLDLILEGPGVLFSGDTAKYNVFGIDDFYNPIAVDLEKVEWETNNRGVFIEEGVLTSGRGGSVKITALLGKVEKTLTVRVLDDKDIEALLVEPASINIQVGQKVSFKFKVKTLEGDVLPVSPEKINWTVPDGLGLVVGGSEFNAPDMAAQGVLKAEFLESEVSIPVNIWLPEPEKPPVVEFKDIKGHWAAEAIMALAERNVVNGFPGELFKPGDKVTRAQLVVMLDNALDWPKDPKETSFSDPMPEWVADAVARAVSQDIVQGYPQGDFRPAKTVTRTEMCVMLNKILVGLDLKVTAKKLTYKDAAKVPGWGLQAVTAVSSAELMKGDTSGQFRPLDTVTRAEAAMVINTLLDKYVK